MYKIFIHLALTLCSTISWGQGGTGTWGGDAVRILFEEAKQATVTRLTNLSPEGFSSSTEPNVAEFVSRNLIAMAEDLQRSQLKWHESPATTCAWTTLSHGAQLHLSLPTCRQSVGGNSELAGKTLIHEIVHHFGVTDESFADAVAIAVFSAGLQDGRWISVEGQGAPGPRHSPIGLPARGAMLLFGGHDGIQILRDGGIYYPRAGIWESIEPSESMNHCNPGRYFGGVVNDRFFYILWECASLESLTNIRFARYHIDEHYWQDLSAPERNRQWVSGELFSMDRTLVVHLRGDGINTGGIRTENHAFDVETMRWSLVDLDDLNHANFEIVVPVSRSEVFFYRQEMMGQVGLGVLYDIERRAQESMRIEAPVEALVGSARNSINLVVVGTSLVFNLVTQRWSQTAELNRPRARLEALGLVEANSMLMGWDGRNSEGNGTLHYYDGVTDVWYNKEAFGAPISRTHYAAVWVDDHYIVWGGRDSRGDTLSDGASFKAIESNF